MEQEIKQKLLNRFIKYAKISSQSNTQVADSGIQPSTKEQWIIAKEVEKELNALGLENVQVTDKCYVYGFLPPTKSFDDESVLLLAHMDTSEEVCGTNVNPILTEKDGDTIIHTDKTTLLGADDKAGLSAIITSIEYLVNHSEVEHRGVEVCFSPDEETGHGMDNVPLSLIKSKYAYTVDGGDLGQLETECFNAYKAEIIFTGKSCHTGSAKNVMKNAIRMASDFISLIPKNQFPETTEKYQGFYAPLSIEGTIEEAKITFLLRDFTKNGMNNKINKIKQISSKIQKKYKASVNPIFTEQYVNMKENLDKVPFVQEKLIQAFKQADVKPIFTPIRGGTDGSRLTELGIPCPNIFTGGYNFHSKDEYASLNEMVKSTEVLIYLIKQR